MEGNLALSESTINVPSEKIVNSGETLFKSVLEEVTKSDELSNDRRLKIIDREIDYLKTQDDPEMKKQIREHYDAAFQATKDADIERRKISRDSLAIIPAMGVISVLSIFALALLLKSQKEA